MRFVTFYCITLSKEVKKIELLSDKSAEEICKNYNDLCKGDFYFVEESEAIAANARVIVEDLAISAFMYDGLASYRELN